MTCYYRYFWEKALCEKLFWINGDALDHRHVTARRSRPQTNLLRRGHEVDGGVVAVVLLRQAEGELVVDEERVCV